MPSSHSYVPRGSGRVPDVGLEIPGYRVQREIGSGGMGVVYQAIDLERRRVAIKILRSHIAHDPISRERLAREVGALSKVHHRGVARILDAELDDDHAFLVTEYVDGPTLDQVVRKRGPMHPRIVIEIGVLLAETLEVIHKTDIIHRDLKPSNVMLDAVNEDSLYRWDPQDEQVSPVIIDFGLAHAKSESRLTATGLVMGTAAYIDPEVILGSEPSAIADWWSWAATLAYIATGQAPFGNASADVMIARVRSEKPKVQDLPYQMRDFFNAAFRKDEKDRPTPAELVQWLKRIDPDATSPSLARRTVGSSTPTTSMYPIGPQTDRAAIDGRARGPVVSQPTGVPESRTPAGGPNQPPAASGPQTNPAMRGSDTSGLNSTHTPSLGVTRYPEPPTDYLNFKNQPRVRPRSVRSTVRTDPAPVEPSTREPETPAAGTVVGNSARVSSRWWGKSLLPVGIITLCLAAATVPILACMVAWLCAVVMFAIAINRRFMEKRRAQNNGPRRSDYWVAFVASPWHGIKAVVVALAISLLPALVGAALAGGLFYGSAAAGGYLPGALCCCVGMLAASGVAWWGLRREDLHMGTRHVIESLSKRERAPRVILIAMLVLSAAAIVAAVSTGGSADLWPFSFRLQ
ncbi:protein kinase [Micrococcales bacterium 31B]|nr:protein kinase [Micrococcales bacterium 31B]